MLKKLFLRTTDWNVAYKSAGSDTYNVVDNPNGYWLADSLLFEDDDCQNYLFVEAFDKKEKIGKLAVLTEVNGVFQNFRLVMEKSYHLSYPFVFKWNGEYYMIPETSGNNAIEVYEATKFPYEWEYKACLLEGNLVDTTIAKRDDSLFDVYTYDMDSCKLLIGVLDLQRCKLTIQERVEDKKYNYRGGGNVFEIRKKKCRAVQDNTYFYGQALNIIECNSNLTVGRMLPEEIRNKHNVRYRRIHTYSKTSEFESIDLSDFKCDLLKPLKKILKKVH